MSPPKKHVSPDYRMRHSFNKPTKANGDVNSSNGSTKKAPGLKRPSASPTEGSYLGWLGTETEVDTACDVIYNSQPKPRLEFSVVVNLIVANYGEKRATMLV
ncbi:hypothetical protein PHYSODRAFT_343110 [Phytophthora sojae]|uniref:Uncharacterized protein n=1 Tax=Phytophthora sojae (strain P6497) TaxID=1094619 RepID=G5AIM8_PHYSP|nr:hypothetical protein PHYSODRAFT_343110 [Phytophthora sojae]EGZ04638.1 hypothetical protein PHYSODRAFT_343110 [Phytophthora sojae]|eukprot:XP_009539929.1 hypothetical protein PHYSODRAFT_343110 [Phytophthora sojae]